MRSKEFDFFSGGNNQASMQGRVKLYKMTPEQQKLFEHEGPYKIVTTVPRSKAHMRAGRATWLNSVLKPRDEPPHLGEEN